MPTRYDRYYKMLTKGSRASPRGLGVSYVQNAVYSFTPGHVVRRDRDNPAIGLIELTQLVAGTFDIESIARVAPNARLDLFTGQSAYGPRIGNQLEKAVEELSKDADSRRAVMMIARQDDTPETIPCTLSIQFQLSSDHKHLVTTVTMRSSDAVWGLPYDMIQFGGLSLIVAKCLDVKADDFMSCSINIGNGHVYDKTMLLHAAFDDSWEFSIPNLDDIASYRAWSAAVLNTEPTRKNIEDIYLLRRSNGRA